jgi:hypothetical protein
MALVLRDRVQETGTANTTVSFTLSGAVTGFQSFSVVGNTNTTYYAATDTSGNWEAGLGTYSTTGPTLTRTTILSSSNSGSAVTFSGTVNVFLTYPSSRALYLNDTSAGINVSQAAFTANGIPYASSTTALATGSALTFNGTNLTTTGSTTATTFIPSGSTAPTNGLYLPAANTLGLSANSTNIARVNSTGLSIGTAITPAARLQIGTTAFSSAAWTTSGLGLRIDAATYTSSAGLTGTVTTHSVAQPTFAATTASQTVTNAATLYIANAPAAGTNVTITNAYALYVAGGSSFMAGPLLVGAGASGITFSTGIKSLLDVGAASIAYTDQSNNYGTGPSIFTDSTIFNYPNAPDSATNAYANYLSPVTFNGNGVNGTTWDFASTLHIAGAPSSSTGTITTGYALSIGAIFTSDKGIYVNVDVDESGLSIASGTAGFGGKAQFYSTTRDKLTVTGNSTRAAWTTTGAAISVGSGTYTSNAGLTGTVVANSIAQPFFAATTASQTVTNAATLYIAAAPSAGSNVTITNSYALYIAAGASFFGGAVTLNSGGALSGTFTGAPTFSGAIALTGSPTITNLLLAAGTASLAPLDFLAGTLLTSPVSGAMEFDGTAFYTTDDTTDGRGYLASIHYFRLAADGGAITTIANFFGSTSGMGLDAGVYYEVEAYLYFTKTTAGTATFTMTFSNGPTNNDAHYVGTPVGGIATVGSAVTAAIAKSTATAGALPATGSLTNGANHAFTLRSMFQANATTGGTLNLQVTSSAGSITPLTGSYYKLTRLPAANTGAFV